MVCDCAVDDEVYERADEEVALEAQKSDEAFKVDHVVFADTLATPY